MYENIHIYQIYYDEASRLSLDSGFTPLDNTHGLAGWFEFWPMLYFLDQEELLDGHWYGFLSPKFKFKTGLNSDSIYSLVQKHSQDAEVILLSHSWDLISFFQNPWEQGNYWHPGITQQTEDFLEYIHWDLDIRSSVTDLTTTVFSNYIIAKKSYWSRWHHLAKKYFQFVESNTNATIKDTLTHHEGKKVAMKTFVQERLSSAILLRDQFPTAALNQTNYGPFTTSIIQDRLINRHLLDQCNRYKMAYRTNKNYEDYLRYITYRQQVSLTTYPPPPVVMNKSPEQPD